VGIGATADKHPSSRSCKRLSRFVKGEADVLDQQLQVRRVGGCIGRSFQAIADLQVADSPAYLRIELIASGVPESSRDLILKGDQRGYATDATLAQIILAGPGQREPDALPPMPIANGKPIHVASPAVPGGDQGAEDLPVPFGDQENGRGPRDQALDVIESVGRTCMLASSMRPQVQYRRHIGLSASTYGDSPVGQVRSIRSLRSVQRRGEPLQQTRIRLLEPKAPAGIEPA
jgi:hypothetical protein